jgi:crescentin
VIRLLNTKDARRAALGKSLPEAAPPEGAESQTIGVRQEVINSSLDSMGQVMEHLGSIVPLLEQVRGPLAEEFNARRAEHAELTALRAVAEQNARVLQEGREREKTLLNRIGELETALSESQAHRQSQEAVIQEQSLLTDRLRNDLAAATIRGDSLDASLREAQSRVGHLDNDLAAVRAEAQSLENRAATAEVALSRAIQEKSLVDEEAVALRKRLDAANGETARLLRVEAELQGQVAAERARVQTLESSAVSAQAEAARAVRSLEASLELNRAEMGGIQARLDTALARANKLEELNADVTQRLTDTGVAQQIAERRAAEMQVSLERAVERARAFEEEAEALHQRLSGLDTARAAAVERVEQLTKVLQDNEKASLRAEERTARLRAQFEALQTAEEAARAEQESRIAALQAELDKHRAEAALVEGALETSRQDRARLQMQLLAREPSEPARIAG